MVTSQSVKAFQDHLTDNINRKDLDLRDAAVKAVTPFAFEYYCNGRSQDAGAGILQNYVHNMQSGEMNTKRGYPLAIGALPFAFFREELPLAINVLREGMEKYVTSYFLSVFLFFFLEQRENNK